MTTPDLALSKACQQRALDFLEACALTEPAGAWRLHLRGEPYFLATAYAVLAFELCDALDTLSAAQRRVAADYLRSFQQPETGLFVHPAFRPSEAPVHGAEYVQLQATMFCVDALAALGEKPAYPLAFLETYLQPEALVARLEALDWRDAWLQSNIVLFLGFLFSQEAEAGNTRAEAALQALLNWLDATQDPVTGYWGSNRGADLFNAMAATFHQLPITLYWHHPPRSADKLVSNTLAFQEYDSLFVAGGGGGACEDLDALDLLAKGLRYAPDLADEVHQACARARSALFQLQAPSGGFPFCYTTPPCPWEACRACFKGREDAARNLFNWLRRKRRWFKRSPALTTEGHRFGAPFNTFDVLSAWFRLLALCYAVLTPASAAVLWHFKPRTGLGWHPVREERR